MTTNSSPEVGDRTPRRARRIGFISVVVLALALVALLATGSPPLLTLPVTGWLPDAALEGLFQPFIDFENFAIHRLHAVGFSLIPWIAFIGLIPQLRAPEKRQAPLWATATLVVVSAALDFTIGLSDPFILPLVALVLAAVALHPQRLPAEPPALSGPGQSVAILIAVAALAYAYGEIQTQVLSPAEDPHAALGHYSFMATLAIALAVAALIGASNLTGRRITAWMTGVMVILMGAFFFGFPDNASSPGMGWGTVTVVLGAAYLFFALRRQPSAPRDVSAATQGAPEKTERNRSV